MSLYQLTKIHTESDSEFHYALSLDEQHDIFKGHFPRQPVLPGVSQIEILGAAIEQETQQKVQLDNAKSIKFLKIIDPTVAKELTLKVSVIEAVATSIKVSAIIEAPEGAYFKFKGTFKHRS